MITPEGGQLTVSATGNRTRRCAEAAIGLLSSQPTLHLGIALIAPLPASGLLIGDKLRGGHPAAA